ncbi:hypothetical protein Tco_0731258 [Tanacetum coccineum]
MKTLEYSLFPQQKEGACSMWEKIDDITFAQDVISTLNKFSVTKTIGLTYMAITLRFKEQLIMVDTCQATTLFSQVRNDLEVVKAATSTPESSDESTKPVEISQTLQLATMFGVWYQPVGTFTLTGDLNGIYQMVILRRGITHWLSGPWQNGQFKNTDLESSGSDVCLYCVFNETERSITYLTKIHNSFPALTKHED